VRPDLAIQRVRCAAGQHLPGAADRAPGVALDSETVVTTVRPRQFELSKSPVLIDRERVRGCALAVAGLPMISVSDRDGRPSSPRGVSTSAGTFRQTRSASQKIEQAT
jgi:hypothetical protein